jgi:hypothetical protein
VSSEVGQTLLVVVTAAEAAIWLVGLWFLARSSPAGKTALGQADLPGPAEGFPGNAVVGAVEVDGQPGDLPDRAASLLAKESGGAFRVEDDSMRREPAEKLRVLAILGATYRGDAHDPVLEDSLFPLVPTLRVGTHAGPLCGPCERPVCEPL